MIPERERWRLFWPEILGHMAQGLAAGMAIWLGWLFWPLAVIGVLLMAASAVYQVYGYIKKSDTLMRDWRDYVIGFGISNGPGPAMLGLINHGYLVWPAYLGG